MSDIMSFDIDNSTVRLYDIITLMSKIKRILAYFI